MGKSIPSCQGEINRVFQPPPELRQGGISSHGCNQGCFQPWPPAGAGPGQPYGLRDHAASPVVQERHGVEVHRLGRRAGETEVKRTAGGPGERRLLNLQRNLSRLGLLIIDELGFEVFSPR